MTKFFSIISIFSNRHSKSGAQSSRENTWDILLSATLNTSTYPTTKVVQHIPHCYHCLHISDWTFEVCMNCMMYSAPLKQKPMYCSILPADVFLKTRIYWGTDQWWKYPLCIQVYSLPPAPTRWCTITVLKNNIWSIFVHKGMQNLSKICAAYIFVSYPDLIGSKVVFGTSLWIIPSASNVGITFDF